MQSSFIPLAKREEIHKIIKTLDTTKSTGADCVPSKVIKLAADIIDEHLTNIINNDISQRSFSKNSKTAYTSTIFKKLGRLKIINYRPICVLRLNTFS